MIVRGGKARLSKMQNRLLLPMSVFDIIASTAIGFSTAPIPRGTSCTYGAIGKFLGSVKSARMVGWAMNSSHNQSPKVPAHRVVNRNGLLTGKHHFSDENTMINLLKDEGIEVINNQVVHFKNHFWDPSEQLAL